MAQNLNVAGTFSDQYLCDEFFFYPRRLLSVPFIYDVVTKSLSRLRFVMKKNIILIIKKTLKIYFVIIPEMTIFNEYIIVVCLIPF